MSKVTVDVLLEKYSLNSLVEEIRRLPDSIGWYKEHQEELFQKYANQWIVILDQEVVGFGSDPFELLKELRLNGVETRFAYVVLLDPDPKKLILVTGR